MMSNPVVANRAPAPRAVAGILDYVRFSLRNEDSQIDRGSLNTYVGTGPVFYQGEELPENLEFPSMVLRSFSGNPPVEVTRAIENDVLRIDSGTGGTSRKGLYYMGGLQSPATPGQPVMVEFTLELDAAEVVPDAQFTGVVAGLFFGDSGFMLRFYTDGGGTQWIEMFDANPSSVQRPLFPALTYRADFDWDSGGSVAYNYKVLWDPIHDRVALYVSSGQELAATDQLLIDGAVSDFPPVTAGNEERDQPWMYFGHGFIDPESTSRWHNAFLFHLVSLPHRMGIVRGEHDGFLVTNNVIEYFGRQPITKADFAWTPIPEVFDTGEGEVITSGEITELRTLEGTFGFVRDEPRVKLGITMVDFVMAADLLQPDITSEASGVEVYLDGGPGSFEARVGFLQDSAGSRLIGLLVQGGVPTAVVGYNAFPRGWGTMTHYRLIVDPAEGATLYEMLPVGDVLEFQIATVPLASLPASSKLVPGFGIMHNGLVAQARSLIQIQQVRYMTNLVRMESLSLPTDQGWSRVGAAAGSVVEEFGTIFTSDAPGEVVYEKPEPDLDGDNGATVEFRLRIPTYEAAGLENPERTVPGVGVSVDDGGQRLFVVFADGGPGFGRIVFLTLDEDIEENLRDIRSGSAAHVDTYVTVDWQQMHTYRIDRTIGGYVTLCIDDVPTIQMLESLAPYIPTQGGGSKVSFGNFLNHHRAVSEWVYVRHSISDGLDIKTRPVLEEEEALARFDHAVNVIVEVEDV